MCTFLYAGRVRVHFDVSMPRELWDQCLRDTGGHQAEACRRIRMAFEATIRGGVPTIAELAGTSTPRPASDYSRVRG